jgi:hypothetical protein
MRGRSLRRLRSAIAPVLLLTMLAVASCVPVGKSRPVTASADDTAHVTRRQSTAEDLTRVRWVRIYGASDETSPPILRLPVKGTPASQIGSDALTLQFDMQADQLPNLTLILIHCDHDWVPTENIFVQDPIRLRSSDFAIERAPVGVHGYDYSCSITFPSRESTIKIAYSGNYIARVVDYYDNSRILTETRFFVVEPKAPVGMLITSGFYQSAQTEVLQHGLNIQCEAAATNDLFMSQIRAIDIYKAGVWWKPMIASYDVSGHEQKAGEYWSLWNSSFGGKAVSQFYNIPAGNEHRILDLTDLTLFPASAGGLLTTPLSDLPRQTFSMFDNNGYAISRFVPLSDAEYVYFEFRLDLKGAQVNQDICVVGTFNDWKPSEEWRMVYDKQSGFYTARGWIKRAMQEYEYVAGKWDEDTGELRQADASLLEGNITSTSQPYYGMVYYKEITGGGYDRIVGVGGGLSGEIQ